MFCRHCGQEIDSNEKKCTKCNEEKLLNEKMKIAYDALRTKQLSYDNLMWQTPVIGIAAQSFLYTIAFDTSKGLTTIIVTSIIAIILGVAAIQLMMKHRLHERLTNDKLIKIESEFSLDNVHEQPSFEKKSTRHYWFVKHSSFNVWRNSLILTTSAGVIAIVIKIWSSSEIICNLLKSCLEIICN